MNRTSDPSSKATSRLVIHFTHLRPYHLARLRSAEDAMAATGTHVLGVAVIDATGTLPPDPAIARPSQPPVILFPNTSAPPPGRRHTARAIFRVLNQLQPTAVAICGYATPDARACLRWCRRHHAQAILMTETREIDADRVWWKEWIKSRLVRAFDGALCGGPEARAYLIKLGMPAHRIEEGYDVVDQEFFATACDRIRHTESAPARRYFLASNRFIPRKNVAGLIEAYALYVKGGQELAVGGRDGDHAVLPQPWNLCLLGDGELKENLIAHCHRLGLQVAECAPWESSSSFNIQHPTSNIVYFPGWQSHADLPRYYAHAGAFVHPALSEPWGLVINEAMACALPILATPATGAATTLLVNGTNGLPFDASSPAAGSRALLTIARATPQTHASFSAASRSLVRTIAPMAAFGRGLANLLSDRESPDSPANAPRTY